MHRPASPRRTSTLGLALGLRLLLGAGVGLACGADADCGAGMDHASGGDDDCGPSEGVVAHVIDGDTVELATGERIRYLLVDTPEVSGAVGCFGREASDFNRTLVEGKTVRLSYDAECTDQYDRLLAYVSLEGRSVNELLLTRGFACVLHIPPNGADHLDEYRRLEEAAQAGQVGLWGACTESPCG
jgi:micrococcal nuclease